MSEGQGLPAPNVTIRVLADQYGLSLRAIRLYEELGLIESTRDSLNWRRYGAEARRRLGVIAVLRSADVPIDEIREVLRLDGCGGAAQGEAVIAHLAGRLETLDRQRANLAEQIDRLRQSLSGAPVRAAGRPAIRTAFAR